MPSRLVAATSAAPSLACRSALGWGLRRPGEGVLEGLDAPASGLALSLGCACVCPSSEMGAHATINMYLGRLVC